MTTKEYRNQKVREYRLRYPERVKESLAKSRKNFPERKLFNAAKNRAKTKGLEFTICKEDISIPKTCPLLGVELSMWGDKDYSPSLDRLDNTKGYTPDNIWVVSFKANRMKNTASKAELVSFARNILKLLQ